jgi:pimeloyl-ACP methyl ester carboxylesterase
MTRKPLILLPGLLCDAALWGDQIAVLADICDVTVGDLTRDPSIPAMAECVLSAAPGRFALAGLSMGGYVAQEIMRRAPERVERLALIDTSARPDTAEQGRTRADLIRQSLLGKFKGVTPRLLPNLIHPSRMNDPAVADVVLAMAERVGQEAFTRQQTAIMGRVDGRGDLPAIHVPTLVLCGRQDVLTPPAFHQEMADAIHGATLIVVEDCGHLAPLERPAAVTAAMRQWLEGASAK